MSAVCHKGGCHCLFLAVCGGYDTGLSVLYGTGSVTLVLVAAKAEAVGSIKLKLSCGPGVWHVVVARKSIAQADCASCGIR